MILNPDARYSERRDKLASLQLQLLEGNQCQIGGFFICIPGTNETWKKLESALPLARQVLATCQYSW